MRVCARGIAPKCSANRKTCRFLCDLSPGLARDRKEALRCPAHPGPKRGLSGYGGVVQKFVYDFEEGNRDLKDLLGGKGANLAEMTNLGLPVPPGFTITTDACRTFLDTGEIPGRDEISEHLAALEERMGRRLGDAADPLLVSVRSGAKFSMPGMMETVLNVGLTDDSVAGLAAQAGGDERFAWDSYRRLIQMFGKTVCDVPGDEFEHALEDAKHRAGTRDDVGLTAEQLKELVGDYKRIFRAHTGHDFPQEPREQ